MRKSKDVRKAIITIITIADAFYHFLPVDFISDVIPVVGQLDDVSFVIINVAFAVGLLNKRYNKGKALEEAQ